jgi:dTDP-4-amino-4,6-dideoxygalactose transaminase
MPGNGNKNFPDKSNMKIPFINLQLQHESIKQEIDLAIQEVLQSSHFIGGNKVQAFEKAFAHTLGVKQCIGTGNGTDSLYLILKALGIGPGDEVLTPAFSCIATAECITLTGATPVFVDVHPEYYTINPSLVPEKITSKTKAILAVHLYGQVADAAALKSICEKYKLFLVEDCAQAHLSSYKNQLAGTFGIAAAFSFYPTKNLGAVGDAGCVLTNDDKLAEKVRRLSNHGALQKNDHDYPGINSRLDALQAAVLLAKLNHLQYWNNQRIEIANLYSTALSLLKEITLPKITEQTKHTFHIYAIRSKHRGELRNHLASKGIETLVHYPKGLPFTNAYSSMKVFETDFPVTSALQNEILSLPIYPGLTKEQCNFIIQTLKEFKF